VLGIRGEEDLSWSNRLIWKAVSGKVLPVYDYPFCKYFHLKRSS
jgi:hypothetical protein